jgi:hypothetical protein
MVYLRVDIPVRSGEVDVMEDAMYVIDLYYKANRRGCLGAYHSCSSVKFPSTSWPAAGMQRSRARIGQNIDHFKRCGGQKIDHFGQR